jgi:sec-independent protein translocase protein TatA
MLGGLGLMEILLIGGGIILLFGAKKIPTLARGLGEGIRNFKGEFKGSAEGSETDGSPKKLKDGESGEKRRED